VTSLDRLDDELAVALELADVADGMTLAPFTAREFDVERKADRSEVTAIDRGAERAIRDRLGARRPDHGVLGEELGEQPGGDAAWRWIVDPIDGTSGYVRGIPIWATLIALTFVPPDAPARVVASVVSAPALGRRWWATAGGGAFADGRPCHVSRVAALADAQISVTFSPGWDALGLVPALTSLIAECHRARGVGDFWQHCLVAEGAVDVAVDAVGVAPYDIAAVRLLVEEAGGRLTDRHGTETHESDTAISSNGLLHDAVLSRLVPGVR
jgi:histidinol-phosphatase